ncbi:MAG: glyoxalase [Pseudonocardiales bacterium]|nr:MAG: glyoxalase [Pseudonocardiales bacterium]
MTERDTAWPAGTPCWVDLMTTDVDAAKRFYGPLLGWALNDGSPETGGYVLADIGGRNVAGLMGMQPGMEHPPVWTTYLATDDAAATAAQITAAGGQVVAPAMDVMGLGVMAVAQDPTGATFGIWQAKEHTGVQLANETGTLTWNELMTRDYPAAKRFYATVFGYTYTDMSSDGFEYSTMEVDGNTVGGIGGLPAEVPLEVPAHWRVYFAVDDADASVAAVSQAGGSVLRPAADMPYGRHADVADAQGAMFCVIKPASPDQA